MTVIRFPGHRWAHCTRKECAGCFLCDGGLALCQTCGGLEGGLPSDCPGVLMSTERQDLVYDGVMDYDKKLGWVERPAKQWRCT